MVSPHTCKTLIFHTDLLSGCVCERVLQQEERFHYSSFRFPSHPSMRFHTLQMSFILTSPNVFADNVTHSQKCTHQQNWKKIASEIPEVLSTIPRVTHSPGCTDKSNQLIYRRTVNLNRNLSKPQPNSYYSGKKLILQHQIRDLSRQSELFQPAKTSKC